jgi:DNA-directed RNA polymerase specialized sigma subunit
MSNELILQYQKEPTKENGQLLLDAYAPYIKANINKWSGIVPQSVLEAHGKHHALTAFKSFDPEKANINTHLYNHISQLSRYIYTHQNTSQIPEHQLQQLGRLNQAKAYLNDQLGREPTLEDLSDHMHLPKVHIERMMTNNRADLINDSDTEFQTNSTNVDNKLGDRIFAIRNQMDKKEQKQFDSLTGFGGTKVLTPQDFGKKFKMKPYEVSRLKTSLAKRFK